MRLQTITGCVGAGGAPAPGQDGNHKPPTLGTTAGVTPRSDIGPPQTLFVPPVVWQLLSHLSLAAIVRCVVAAVHADLKAQGLTHARDAVDHDVRGMGGKREIDRVIENLDAHKAR